MSSQTKIRLQNLVTDEKVDFQLTDSASPALALKLNKRDELIAAYQEVDEAEDSKKLVETFQQLTELSLDAMCIILTPANGLPKGYKNKRELIADCYKDYSVAGVVIEVFYKALSDSTASPEASEIRKRAVAAVEVIK